MKRIIDYFLYLTEMQPAKKFFLFAFILFLSVLFRGKMQEENHFMVTAPFFIIFFITFMGFLSGWIIWKKRYLGVKMVVIILMAISMITVIFCVPLAIYWGIFSCIT